MSEENSIYSECLWQPTEQPIDWRIQPYTWNSGPEEEDTDDDDEEEGEETSSDEEDEEEVLIANGEEEEEEEDGLVDLF